MDFWAIYIPIPLALAVIATLGYLFGRRRRSDDFGLMHQSRRELRRAQHVAAALEKIAWRVRKNLAKHRASIDRFKERVARLNPDRQEAIWKELRREAEEMLKPTSQLASQMAVAYDEIRQQTANLMTFMEVRTDPLTGVHNRRGLDETLSAQFAMMTRYESTFAIAFFDIDHFKQVNDQQGHLHGDRILQDLAKLLDDSVRETDVVARYGGEEFVVVMPQTDLEGAVTFAERLRSMVEQEMLVTVSGGVTVALDGDTHESLFDRADGALYHAKASGRNRVFCHTGEQVQPVCTEFAEPAV